MSKQEMAQIITLLAGNYNSIAEKTKEQKQLMMNTWQECLGDLEYKVVLQAVKRTMLISSYPPTIADIRTCKSNQKQFIRGLGRMLQNDM